GGAADRRQRDPPLADVELRGRGPPPAPAAPRSRAEADPSTLRARARSHRPPVRAGRTNPHLRRLPRARADVRGRARLLLDDLQLADRAPRARRLRIRAQPEHPREAPRALPALDPARQAHARAVLL